MRRIGIIDIGVGNLGSLAGAIDSLGLDCDLVTEPRAVAGYDTVILPGVGSFAHVMGALAAAEMEDALRSHAADAKPLLGICLGMQVLFDVGLEGGSTKGLGILPGQVRRMTQTPQTPLPHVGWNELMPRQAHPLLAGVKPGVDFYFVHSYRADCAPELVIGAANYGEEFPAIVARGSVVGMQFHPEKSQKNGLKLLENFCWWDGAC